MKKFTLAQDGSGQWIATSDTLPGFIARGQTPQEAIEKMKMAIRVYFPCGECREE